MKESQWYCAQLYYYDEDKTSLILHCVQPLVRAIKAQVEKVFFTRHWAHGPHIRLCCYCTEVQFHTTIQPLISQVVEAYLQRHPSQTLLNEQELAPLYALAAAQEDVREPVLPLYPNNSLRFAPYDQRLHVLGSTILANIIEDFYVDTNEIVFAMMEYVTQGHSLLNLSLDLMLAVAHTQGMHLSCGFISYRSHAERFIITCSNPQQMRAVLDQKYQQRASELVKRVYVMMNALDQREQRFPFVLSWCDLMSTYWQRAQPLISSGELDMLPFTQDGIPEYPELVRRNIHQSKFHSALDASYSIKKALYADHWFECYRLMLNLLYLHINRLGVRPNDRFMLAHLIANSVEEALQIQATNLITSWDTTQPIDQLQKGKNNVRLS